MAQSPIFFMLYNWILGSPTQPLPHDRLETKYELDWRQKECKHGTLKVTIYKYSLNALTHTLLT